MPTKKEMLEKMTVKELKQMARDKDLPGYSTKNKSGLVEMIEKNYLKREIGAWPELEEEVPEKVEPEPVREPTRPALTKDPAGIAMAVAIIVILLLYYIYSTHPLGFP